MKLPHYIKDLMTRLQSRRNETATHIQMWLRWDPSDVPRYITAKRALAELVDLDALSLAAYLRITDNMLLIKLGKI